MKSYYTDEKNIQILIALLKHHGVRRIVVSPGATNITFVASVQSDPYFYLYSSVDERSAAYIACGMAAETGEPVALSCTGATAARNYMPGLTEAYYRKLPVLAITSTQHLGRIGNMVPQVTDRTNVPNDICRLSIQCPSVNSDDDYWACEASINRALLELTHYGGGPVHINLATTYSKDFSASSLPEVRCVDRITSDDAMPSLSGRKIAVFVGAHQAWSERLTRAVDAFCEKYNAAVLCDRTSNYAGRFRVDPALVTYQDSYISDVRTCDIVIHIGEVSGSYITISCDEVWRVSPDGEPRDPFRKLRYIFDMDESSFFEAYEALADTSAGHLYYEEWVAEDDRIRAKIPELPLSNPWLAQVLSPMLPKESVLHLGILNTLRSWNMFSSDISIRCYCNTGGFGIDGCISSLIGASIACPEKLYFGVIGDLACFYDLNSLGNRHIASNMRLLVVNNGVGTEFKNSAHDAAAFGDDADPYMAARGHFGSQSRTLLRDYARDLGFEYIAIESKEDLLASAARFVDPEPHDLPMLMEVFTDSQDESDALEMLRRLEVSASGAAKKVVKNVLGDKGIKAVKKMLRR